MPMPALAQTGGCHALEPAYNLFRISTAKARTTICRLVLSFLSQFFQRRRHCSSQPVGAERGAGLGGLQQSQVRREGQLLFGSMLADGRGGVDGTGGQQQLRDLGGLSGTTEGEALWAIERDLGQCPGAPWRGSAGISQDARTGAAAGEPPFSRGQALPGYSPDFNGDEAIWGWAREEATGNLCLGTKAKVQERVGGFLAGLVGRQEEVKRRCRTILQSRAQALLRDSSPDSQHPANVHPTLALV